MGLDDFASAEELNALQEEGLQKNADPQDEDLFDFPDMTLYEWDSSSKEEEEEEAAEAEEQQPAAALPSEEAQEERSEQETPTAAMSPDADPSLDEDIFNFNELFTAAESEAGNDMVPATDLFEPDAEAGDPFEAEQDDHAQADEAPAETVAVTPRSRTPRSHSREELATVVLPQEPAESPLRSRLVMGLAAGFIIVNSLVLFLAWRASRSFESAMDSVRAEMRRAPQVVTVAEPTTAEGPEALTPLEQPSPEPLSIPEAELLLAQRELEGGFFDDARKRLFRLLANRDRLTTAEGDELARAEYLIARSYMLQAEAISARQEGSR